MNIKKVLFFAAAAAIFACGCASSASSKKLIKKGLYDCNDRLETAMKRIEKKNYNDAIRILDEIKYQCGGSSSMDTVYYHTAMSHLRLRQYTDARVEFENLLHEHPRSNFVEESYYRLGQMRYLKSNKYSRDQTETKEAIRLLGDYMDLYPNGAYADSVRHFHTLAIEKLAEKEYRNAMFYYKQKEYEAALIYFNSLLSQYPRSKYTSEAAVGMAEALFAAGRVEDAREAVEELEFDDFGELLQKRLAVLMLKLNQPADTVYPASKNRRVKANQPEPVESEVRVDYVIEPEQSVEMTEVNSEAAETETESNDAEQVDEEQVESDAGLETKNADSPQAEPQPEKTEAEKADEGSSKTE
jgi:outer membrane protein assembly factor BamD